MNLVHAFDTYHPVVKKMIGNIEKVMVGKHEEIKLSLVALLAEGHVLLEDVPGVGKTMMVKAIAQSISGQFNRIQFTADLLPSDLMGVSIYNQRDMEFEFRPGPLMGNIILADEVNRTSPKTRSALLEGMEEGNMTVDGRTHVLPKPFLVMATQNPIEYEGTYTLPEAQLDRFLIKMKMGYPTMEEELEILNRIEHSHPINKLEEVVLLEELLEIQQAVKDVYIGGPIKKYIIELVTETRHHPSVELGVSPRGSLALMKASQAYAFIHNRDYVIPDDVKYLCPYVLSHRILLNLEAKFEGMSAEKLIKEIIERVKVPIIKEERVR